MAMSWLLIVLHFLLAESISPSASTERNLIDPLRYLEASIWAANLIPSGCDSCETIAREDGSSALFCDTQHCKWDKLPTTFRYAFNNLKVFLKLVETVESQPEEPIPTKQELRRKLQKALKTLESRDIIDQFNNFHNLFSFEYQDDHGVWFRKFHTISSKVRQIFKWAEGLRDSVLNVRKEYKYLGDKSNNSSQSLSSESYKDRSRESTTPRESTSSSDVVLGSEEDESGSEEDEFFGGQQEPRTDTESSINLMKAWKNPAIRSLAQQNQHVENQLYPFSRPFNPMNGAIADVTSPRLRESLLINPERNVYMPLLGFGTAHMWDQGCYNAVKMALEAGYRHIDTAQSYENEQIVGQAIRDFLDANKDIKRKDLFIATKFSAITFESQEEIDDLEPQNQGNIPYKKIRSMVRRQFLRSLEALQTDYIDVYMLHHSFGRKLNNWIWQELEQLYKEGFIKALGVSSFTVVNFQQLVEESSEDGNFRGIRRIQPHYLQNKFTIYQPSGVAETKQAYGIVQGQKNWIPAMNHTREYKAIIRRRWGQKTLGESQTQYEFGNSLLDYCHFNNVTIVGFSQIHGSRYDGSYLKPMDDPHVLSVLKSVNGRRVSQITPAQLLHIYSLHQGIGVIPKSIRKERIIKNKENLFDVILTREELRILGEIVLLSESQPGDVKPIWATRRGWVGEILEEYTI